jgi:predicted Zn-dependent peptidase
MNKIIKFDSGLTLAVTPMSNTRSLSIGVFVETGSINETPENNGISHLIEHMVFKGTATRNAYDIADEMESIGANINAFTSKNMTAYYTVSTDEYARQCIDILSDIYLNATFTEENLQREKGVIVEEINMTEDNGEDLCFELVSKAHFKDSPLALPILGTAETVNAINYKMIKDYMSRFYTADNTYIVMTGNISESAAVELVKEFFEGKIKPNGEKSHRAGKYSLQFSLYQRKASHAQGVNAA